MATDCDVATMDEVRPRMHGVCVLRPLELLAPSSAAAGPWPSSFASEKSEAPSSSNTFLTPTRTAARQPGNDLGERHLWAPASRLV